MVEQAQLAQRLGGQAVGSGVARGRERRHQGLSRGVGGPALAPHLPEHHEGGGAQGPVGLVEQRPHLVLRLDEPAQAGQRLGVADVGERQVGGGQRRSELGGAEVEGPAQQPLRRVGLVAGERSGAEPHQRGERDVATAPGRVGARQPHLGREVHGPLALQRRGAVDVGRPPELAAAVVGVDRPGRGGRVAAGALGLGEPRVRHVAHQGVGEAVGAVVLRGRPAGLQQPAVDQLVDGRLHHARVAVAARPADRDQPGHGHAQPQHAGVAQHALGRPVEPVDARGEHRLHPCRQDALGQVAAQRPPVAGAHQRAAVDEQVEQLGEEERVALRPGEQRRADGEVEVVGRGAEVGPQQALDRALLERQHRQQLDRRADPATTGPHRRVRPARACRDGRRRAAARGPSSGRRRRGPRPA